MTPTELFLAYERIPRNLSRHYATLVPMEREDLESEGRVMLWKCAVSYDPSKGIPFAPWAHKMVNWAIQKMIAKHNKERKINTRCYPPGSPVFDSTKVGDIEDLSEQREVIEAAKRFKFLWRKVLGYSALYQSRFEDVSQVSISKHIRKAIERLQYC